LDSPFTDTAIAFDRSGGREPEVLGPVLVEFFCR
jgi:hypothetical protein